MTSLISSTLGTMLGTNNIVPTSYGRTALYLALMAVDVRGKQVMVPALTCATALTPAISQAGGSPIFVDISPATLDLDPVALEDNRSSGVRVVISHHYYGSIAPNIKDVQRFAAKHRLVHIEDCTH